MEKPFGYFKVLAVKDANPLDSIYNAIKDLEAEVLITHELTFPRDKFITPGVMVSPFDRKIKSRTYKIIVDHIRSTMPKEHLEFLHKLLDLNIIVGIISTTPPSEVPRETEYDTNDRYQRDLFEIAYRKYETELIEGFSSVRKSTYRCRTILALRVMHLRYIPSVKHYGSSPIVKILTRKRYRYTDYINPDVILLNEEKLYKESLIWCAIYKNHYILRKQWIDRSRYRFLNILKKLEENKDWKTRRHNADTCLCRTA